MTASFIQKQLNQAIAGVRAGPFLTCRSQFITNQFVPNMPPQGQLFDSATERKATRLLAVDPTTKGFGFVIFELPFRLVKWGLAHVAGEKYAGAIARFEELLKDFRPERVVLEDADAPGSRRQPRVRRLIEALGRIAHERGIAVTALARTAVLKCFAEDGRATKQQIAERLARDFPALRQYLPRPRKPWESQNETMSVFDALALAVAAATA